ncbi:flagellar basal body rod protein FlgB [Brevibacillus migulae]|uniref:flagellar basal body rod protein FlgB n=1 Tax=Brevibacillus migulae TaxID=1644114 RepID=UPI00106E36A7|nr:flagellar basal body rod protein FlgB [Brevibacillus migulae]
MINTEQIRMLERSLDAATLRQRTIANNIANLDTPHFKSKQVVFEDLLQQELSGSAPSLQAYRTNSRHIAFGAQTEGPIARVVSNPNGIVQNNGNDVDVEYEMNQLAKNQIWYNGLTQMTNGYFTKIRSVLEGGK